MSDQFFRNPKMRVVTALVLLCAMLLSACGALPPLPPLPGEEDEPAATAAQSETAIVTPEPTPEPFVTDVVLSELQAANKATLPDADGDFSDWIELYNPGADCEITGCYLSDDEADLCKWAIPSLTMASGAYQTVFCSGKDRTEGELHTSFKLSGSGDTLYFSSPAGQLLWSVSYDGCADDAVLRFAGEDVTQCYYPTPSYPNDESGFERFCAEQDHHGALVVNEAVTYNDDFNMHAGECFDWVELRNLSDASITLSDYFVTDNADNPTKFRLPEVNLGPGELFLFYCGEPSALTSLVHTDFKLDSAGEGLYIYHADGSLSDFISLYGIPLNHSKGRLDGQNGFFLFANRTPGTHNGAGAREITARPLSVTEPGIHNDVTSLDVELSAEGAIYYTLDGNEPTVERGTLYTGPIHLDGTTQIRAIAAADGKLTSEIETYTYLLNENHTLPVVCVTLAPMKLDILYNRNHNMEYDSHTEYYGPEGSFASDCMITLHGAASKSVWTKKSFKVVFKDRYGGDVKFDLFGQGIDEFHSLNLRGGDSVFMHTFREPLAAEVADLVAVQDPFALDSRFCILYMNGKYWGIYTLREAYSAKYVADHTGSDEDLVSISRAPIKTKYQPELFDLYTYVISHDLTDPDNFNYVADRMDLESFAQWLLLETYFNNIDPFGNIRYCIGNQPDGRWRTMFFDLDKSMTNGNAAIFEMIGKGHKPSQIGNMNNNLLRSPYFQAIFLNTAAGLYRNGLSGEKVLEIFDRMTQEVEPEMDRNLKRWGESRALYDSTLTWQRTVFNTARDESWLSIVQSFSGADDATMAALFPPRG